jgi:hypothetical protein
MAPVLAGDFGASESEDKAVGESGLRVLMLAFRRMDSSFRRCVSSSVVFLSLDF